MWTKMGKSRVCSELGRFAKREAVLCIAFFCAVVSMLFVPPDRTYLGYLDIRVLALLFCLMLVVAGLEETGLFQVLAQRLLVGRKRFRILSLALVLLPFFSSMLITNDVALLTFVPFAILMLELIGRQERLAYLVVLQTVAANLGSMATPVGNPQNLFLCSKFEIPMGDFFAVMLPLTAVSLLGLCTAALCVSGEAIEVQFCQARNIENKGLLWLMLVLFGLSLLSVFRVLPYGVLFAVVVLSALFCTRPLFLRVDYGLLATFVCFFLFSGNLGRIPTVRELLTGLLGSNTAMTAGLASDQQCARRRAALRIYGRLARAAGRHGCRRPGDADRLSGQPDLAQIVSPLTGGPARELSGAVPGGERCGHFTDGRGCLAVSVEGRDPL